MPVNRSPRMSDVASLRLSRDSLGQKAADVLRRQILTGELPAGARLVEDELASRMGTSRGPLRDAFVLLSREGLVSTTQGKGTYVKGITVESLRQLYEVRVLLEEHAAALAAQNIDDVHAAQMRGLVEQMAQAARLGDQAEYVRLDEDIHQEKQRLAGNKNLVNVLEYLIVPCMALITLNAQTRRDWPIVVEYHRQLAEAIASHDSDAARRIMREQLEDSLEKAVLSISPRS